VQHAKYVRFAVVREQPGAQEKFLEIKSAYQTLVDSKSRSKYDAASSRSARSDDWDPFQWGSSFSSGRKQEKEEFYGLGTILNTPLFMPEGNFSNFFNPC